MAFLTVVEREHVEAIVVEILSEDSTASARLPSETIANLAETIAVRLFAEYELFEKQS